MYILKYGSIAFLLFGFLFASCKKDLKYPPALPSEETFIFVIDDFELKSLQDTTMVNWWRAKSIVKNWNLTILENLSVPISSYLKATKTQNPLYQSDNTWLWEYDFYDGEINYSSKLFGTENTDSVIWEMYITKEGEYNDFLWFSGICFNNNNTVLWKIYDNPDNAEELMSINYNKQSSDVIDIKFTNISPSDAENGSYFLLGKSNTDNFNRYFKSFTKTDDKKLEITWSSEIGYGKISSFDLYQDSNWHCWDESLKDVDCN